MTLRFPGILVLGLWISGAVAAQEKSKPSFDTLLEQVKKSDPKADFLRLRMAFTETKQYDPYGEDLKTRGAMSEALEKEDYAKAAELAEKIMKEKYVDLRAHLVASRAYSALKKEEQAKYHKYVFDGLLQSILKSGDGKSPATAYVVIGTDEEYVVLGASGIRRTAQALIGEKDQKFDRVDGIDLESKERVTRYFNITRQFSWLEQQFKKDK
jgi:hypothetical protein